MSDISKGFNDWRHLHPRIPDHENSQDHRSNYLAWKQLEKRLKEGQCIDAHLQDAINCEKAKWRYILKAVLHAILFCAANNLALRGSDEKISSQSKAGIFLNLIELLCQYDDLLAQHVTHLKKGSLSYLSPTIQNEFIELLASRIRAQIISKIKSAKYYAILFDSTPDTSRQEQMSQVIRYVEVSKNRCIVQESFIDFIITSEKTGEGLASDIIEKLKNDDINISDMRGQGYDNGANMAGKYNGVQAHILRENSSATFVPCSAHSLNLIGVHAASVTVKMVSFFGTVQNLYSFLSASTSRWEILMSFLKVTLKGHSQTRWSSKARAISSLKNQLPKVVNALKEIAADIKQADALSVAKGLLTQMLSCNFVATLVFWNVILCSMDKVNIALQKKGLAVDQAVHMLSGLKKTVMDWRDDDNFKLLFEDINNLANAIGVENKFLEPRPRKVRRMATYESEDQSHTARPCDSFKLMCYEVIDSICGQLQWRYDSLSTILSDFQFLFGPSLKSLSKEDLRKHASDFALKYSNDVDGYELCVEVESFKFQAAEIIPNLEAATPLELLTILHEMQLVESYPNIEIALRIFLTLPVSTASCERSSSKLKLIKNYLRSTMGQERLSGLAVLSIEHELTRTINFDHILDKFAATKARKIRL